MPVSSIASSTAAFTIFFSPRRLKSWVIGLLPAIEASRPSSTFSRTVRRLNSSARWKVRPSPRRERAEAPMWLTSASLKKTLPRVGRRSPEQALKVVVFPAPLGPTAR